MTNLDLALKQLKKDLLEMMQLVKSQIERNKEALDTWDKDIVHEIIANEKRVDVYELKIDMDCENTLALYSPVAVDLRFVMAAYDISSSLERIGDNARKMANFVLEFESPLNAEVRSAFRFDEMYSHLILMFDEACVAYEKEDTKLVRKVFKQDTFLNEIFMSSHKVCVELIKKYPDLIEQILYLYTIIKKLERIGDIIKNIAEELIFYIEAKVLKHKKLAKELNKEIED